MLVPHARNGTKLALGAAAQAARNMITGAGKQRALVEAVKVAIEPFSEKIIEKVVEKVGQEFVNKVVEEVVEKVTPKVVEKVLEELLKKSPTMVMDVLIKSCEEYFGNVIKPAIKEYLIKFCAYLEILGIRISLAALLYTIVKFIGVRRLLGAPYNVSKFMLTQMIKTRPLVGKCLWFLTSTSYNLSHKLVYRNKRVRVRVKINSPNRPNNIVIEKKNSVPRARSRKQSTPKSTAL